MRDFFKRLFCHHSWKKFHTIEDIYYNEEWDKYPAEILVTEIYKCEKCGRVKKRRYYK